MSDLVIVAAQPNPPGRDRAARGSSQNRILNEEWIEIRAATARSLIGDEVWHRTHTSSCVPNGVARYYKFGSLFLSAGQSVRVHTGVGQAFWEGSTHHVFAGHDWFKWNNACGDRVTVAYSNSVIDYAEYSSNPPECVLVRQAGTHLLVPRSRLY